MSIRSQAHVTRRRPDDGGMAWLALGFRPFFLLAALLAAAAVPVWVAQFFGVLPQAGFVAPMAWHTHEMVFGFAVAVITGFLFTAVRNWTGLPTPTGRTLGALASLWLLGRIFMLTGPGWAAAIADIAFLPAIVWFLWQPLRRVRNRNQFFVAILLLLAALNAGFHLAHAGAITLAPIVWVHAALLLVVLVVAIMGGRVIPAFTRNAIPAARMRRLPGIEAASLATLAATLVAWTAGLPDAIVALLAFATALAHAVRLWSWNPWATRSSPILWILHLSYAWIALGMLLLAVALAGIAGSSSAAMHALGIGAVGGMIIGMMTRTARGHTGRPLEAEAAEVTAYTLVHLAAAIRVFLPLLLPQAYAFALVASAVLWSAAFAIYCVVYWPILTRARVDGQPG
ncbi:MAG: NnrS family protein [Betaproteobacteria bacterium]|nr:NnrS family protein [Betaproteobacteria bacterium]